MNERLKRIIFKKLDQDLGHAEIIVDDNKSIWFIDRANKFWYLELRTSGTLWWRYTFFKDFFPLFGLERIEYEPVIAEWVEEVLKRGVSSTLRAFGHFGVEEVLKLGVSSTTLTNSSEDYWVEEALNRGVTSTGGTRLGLVEEVEEVLKRKVNSTLSGFPLMDVGVEEVLKREVFSTIQSKIDYQNQVGEVLKRGVSSLQRNHMNDCDEMEEALKRGVYSTQCNVGLQGSRPVEEVLKPKASPTTVDNLSAVVTMKKVLSLKAGVRECKMKMKKIFKKIIS